MDVLEIVTSMGRASLAVRGEVAAHDEMMYRQKASLVHSP